MLPLQHEAVVHSLKTPSAIQSYIDSIPYADRGEIPGDYDRSVRQAFEDKRFDCVGGGLLAAYCLDHHGYGPATVVGLDAEPSLDDSHLIAVYRQKGLWGSISKSAYAGCRGRDPVYATLRELVMSYFEFYVNKEGIKTLRGYSNPIVLDKADPKREWVTKHDVKDASAKVCKATDKARNKVLKKHFRKKNLSSLRGDTLRLLVP